MHPLVWGASACQGQHLFCLNYVIHMDAVTTQKVPSCIHPSIITGDTCLSQFHLQVSLQPNVYVLGTWEDTRDPWTQTAYGTQNHLPKWQHQNHRAPLIHQFQ